MIVSGDTGFYSLLSFMRKNYSREELNVIPGISSYQYLFSRIREAWQDYRLLSVHGRETEYIEIFAGEKGIVLLTDGINTPYAIAKNIYNAGYRDVEIVVGERLSYPDEKITFIDIKEYEKLNREFAINIVIVRKLNIKREKEVKNLHIYDKDFVQGELPMTKQEVRAVTVAKLQLKPNSILIDVGAGTGTIGIECATYISNGKVIGIEKEEKGLETIKENVKKFNLTNYELIHGRAPEAIPNITYDRMFIGGSTGSMKNILEHFIKYSTVDARLVINTITLESLNDTMSLLKEYGFKDIEVVNMMVSRGKKIGPYTMMYGENPIYIITVDKNSL